jgi:RNA polymerase sigma-70 factor (ECF subfamily)
MTVNADTAPEESAILERLRLGDPLAAVLVMRCHNRALWRIARGILRDDADAEDAVQETYLRAFTRMHEFRGDASLGTWLGRIAVNEALRRLERRRVMSEFLAPPGDDGDAMRQVPDPGSVQSPEHLAARQEIRRMVERAVDRLPAPFRMVFILRTMEQLSIHETADTLGIPAATVKTRLHRAIQLLRHALGEELATALDDAFPFDGRRCDRLTVSVLRRLGLSCPGGGNLFGLAPVQ